MKSIPAFLSYKSFPPVLLYHRIALTTPKEDPLRLGVPPEVFELQMKLLYEKGYKTINLDEFTDVTRTNEKAYDKRIVITFDDGYLDNYTNAFPILQEYGFSATIFIVTDFIDKINAWDSGKAVRLMEWSHVKEMSAHGISFESHTNTHPDLTTLTDQAVLQEFFNSRKKIEDILGIPVQYLSYPYGRYDQRIIQLAGMAGYQFAWAAGLASGGRFSQERFQIRFKHTAFLFALVISGRASWIRKIRHFRAGDFKNKRFLYT